MRAHLIRACYVNTTPRRLHQKGESENHKRTPEDYLGQLFLFILTLRWADKINPSLHVWASGKRKHSTARLKGKRKTRRKGTKSGGRPINFVKVRTARSRKRGLGRSLSWQTSLKNKAGDPV